MLHTLFRFSIRNAVINAAVLLCLSAGLTSAVPITQGEQQPPVSQGARTFGNLSDAPSTVSLAPGYCASSGGSTRYESIRSVTLKPKSNNTLELTVQVFIANPTGCQSGEPCPQYDSSPENVNAWIDWNGNKVWEPSERVMDRALTGYGSINYGGSMTAISQISVPDGATPTTWLRANLAWSDDADDPCREAWTWGNVFDQQVSVKSPTIKTIKVKGSRDVDNPMTAYDVTVEAELDTPSGYEIVKVTWSGDIKPGDGNPYTYRPDKGSHGAKKIKATVSYKHTATDVTGQVSKDHQFKLFFEKSGDEDGDGIPNWFEHWGNDGAVTELTATDVVFSAAATGYGAWSSATDKLTLGSQAAATHYSTALTLAPTTHCPGGTFGGAKGIDSVAEVLAHERQHELFWENWHRNGTWVIGATVDTDDPTPGNKSDIKGDMMPDSYETATSKTNPNDLDSCDLETKKDAVYKWYGDEEFMAIKAGHGKTGDAAKDWSNPGKQSNPPFGAIVGAATTEERTTRQVSGPSTITAPHHPAQQRLPDLASLNGAYADAGVDVNGDGLFEFLRIDVGVDVATPGEYSVRGWLHDEAERELAWAVTTVTLAAGSKTVSLDFDGELLNLRRSNGPYSLARVEIVMGDRDDLVDYGDRVHTTAIYEPDAFVPPAALFTDVYADRGVDANGDSVFERLEIDVGVQINVPGTYTIVGRLHDATGTPIPHATADATLGASATATLAFDGASIAWQRADGPFQLRGLEVRDAAGDRIVYRDFAYTTSAYLHRQFAHEATAIVAGSYTDQGMDADGDGKFDYLQVTLTVDAETAESVTISALLAADMRTTLAVVEQDMNLSLGETMVRLLFPAGSIRAGGVDGPFQVTDITLMDASGAILDYQKSGHTTGPYRWEDFDAPLLTLTGAYGDQAVDEDGDGRMDWLEVTVTVLPGNSGSVQMQGWLADRSGELFAQAESETAVQSGEAMALPLRFDAGEIAGHGVDGPYEVRNLLVFHAGDPTQALEVASAHTTAAYRASDLAVVDAIPLVFLPLVATAPIDSDNVADAIVIHSGQTVNGTVSQADRDDVYQIAAQSGQEIAVLLSGTGGDADLYLYPPGTTDVTSDPPSAASYSEGNDEWIQGTILTGGTWYIDVYSYAGSTNYALTVTLGNGAQAASLDFLEVAPLELTGRSAHIKE